MTGRLVALAARAPDIGEAVDAMMSVAPDLYVCSDGEVLRFYSHTEDSDGEEAHPVLAVDAPVLIPVHTEIARLLGPEATTLAPSPPWWIEIRAADHREHSDQLARRFGDELIKRTAGVLWPPADEPGRNGSSE